MSAAWRLSLFVAIVVAILLAVLRVLEHAPAAVIPASDRSMFSAERAYAHLEDLLSENVPHPSGSAANDVIAQRIVAKLRAAGYEPEMQEGLKCSPLAPGCSVVRNIIAVRKGQDAKRAILVSSHYDSVPGSAAAADDGAGVAAMLEIAERMAGQESPLHDVVFLFADAEETGLRGAMLFADSHPLMERIAFVLNMEARGVSGPSLMFETGGNNAALVDAFADAVSRPVASSLLFEVYRRMPNNTDFTVYKQKGASGLNFAFSRGASLYHSERDDLAHLDKASLQHQGENVSAALQRLANTPLQDLTATTDATYFDVGGRALPRWPANWNPFLAAACLILVVITSVRSGGLRVRSVAWALLAVIALVLLVPASGWLLSWPLGVWPGVHPLDHPYPWPGRIALIVSSVVAAYLVAAGFSRRTDSPAMAAAVWIVTGLFALLAALTVPGATYFWLVPLLAYAVSAVVATATLKRESKPLLVATAVALTVAAYMALYHFLLLELVFSFQFAHAAAIPLIFLALPLLPLASECAKHERMRAVLSAGSALLIVAALAGYAMPTTTIDRPRGVNLLYVQDNAAAHWQIESFGDPEHDVLEAMKFDSIKQSTLRFGVLPTDAYRKPAPNRELIAPELVIDEDVERAGQRIVRGKVRSRRESYQLLIGLPAKSPVLSLHVDGQPLLQGASGDPRVVRFHGVGNSFVAFELTARAGAAVPIVVLDIGALDAAGEAAEMLSRRPDSAAPLHNGNQSIVMTHATL